MVNRYGSVVAVLSLVGLLMAGRAAHAATMVKIGIIDLQKALNATSEGIEAKESLRKKHMTRQEQIDAMTADLDTMEEKLKSPVLSEDAQAELKQRYKVKRAELLEFVAKAKEDEERENQALSAKILDGLIEIAREIAADEEYTVILEKSSSGVLYSQETLDLTERCIKLYNQKYHAGEKQ